MDDICQIKRCHYFAYGSNLNTKRLRARVGVIHDSVWARLDNWIFRYNKKSNDQTSKANIEYSPDNSNFTLGVCYEIDSDDFHRLHKNCEKGYNVREIWTKSKSGFIVAKTFVSGSTWSKSPSKEYINVIVAGAKEHSFPEDYIAKHLYIE